MELIYIGAEAELWADDFLGIPCIRKIRKGKEYRDKRLDSRIRAERTRNEVRMLVKARKAVKTPHILDLDMDTSEIVLEKVPGEKVRDILYRGKKAKELGEMMGEAVRSLHKTGIVHNDLTTSNFLYDGKDLWLIDFGLAKSSDRLEDRATDLVVFKRMMKASHWEVFEDVWPAFLKGYNADKKVLKKIEEIEKRAKYMR